MLLAVPRPGFARVIVRDHADRFLMAVRTARAGGSWNFPGGKIRAGEIPAAAAAREVLEETGVMVAAVELTLLCMGDYELEGVNWRGFYFVAKRFSGTPVNKEPGLHADVGFYGIDLVLAHGSKQFVLDPLQWLSAPS